MIVICDPDLSLDLWDHRGKTNKDVRPVWRGTLPNATERPCVIPNYDRDGNMIGLQILETSRGMENPGATGYAIAS